MSLITIFDPLMHAWQKSIMVLLFLGISHFSEAQEPRQSYHFLPGDIFLLDIDIQQNTHSESISEDAISLYSRSRMEFRIDSLEEPDIVHMTVQYKDLVLSMLAPEMDVDVNSSSGSNKLLTSLMDSLEQFTFSVVTDAKGALLQQRGISSRFDYLASIPVSDTNELEVILNTLREVYGPDAFSSLFSLFVSVYPVIYPISNWTNDVTYFFNTKPVLLINRYQLTRSTGELMVIQGIGMIDEQKSFRERTDMGEVESVVSGSQTYDFQMDRSTGWVRQCMSRQRLLIETTILDSPYLPRGLKIPSYTETVFEVKGLKRN
jgi:hypothetical protein